MTDQPNAPEPVEQEQFPTVIARKHKIKRYHRKISDHWFWAAEVWPPSALKPAVTVLIREDEGTLEEATKEAERYVRVMIQNGGRLPATEIKTDVTFDTRSGTLDGLNPRSVSGKPQWCPKHWAAVERGMIEQTHNGIVAGMLLTSEFITRIRKDGLLRLDQDIDAFTMEMLRDSYSPFCCWLGEAKVQEIMNASTPQSIEESGLLKALEQSLRKPK